VDGGGGAEQRPNDSGCAFPFENAGGEWRRCGAPRRPGSSYCAAHHLLCHIVAGSAAEARRLRQIEALADAVGGRQALRDNLPPQRFLDRLEQLARVFS
jgi:hypothetical protein